MCYAFVIFIFCCKIESQLAIFMLPIVSGNGLFHMVGLTPVTVSVKSLSSVHALNLSGSWT